MPTNRRRRIRMAAITTAVGALASVSAPLAAQNVASASHASFSGVWTLDPAQTQGENAPSASTYTIAQQGDTLIVDRVTTTMMGPMTSHVVYGIDGSAWQNSISLAGTAIPLSSTLGWHGDTLFFHTTGSVQGTAVDQTDRWLMAADGKSFSFHREASVGGQSYPPVIMVFVKQK